MPRLRAVRTKEEAAKVPEDQSISVVITDEDEVTPKQELADGQQAEKKEEKQELKRPEIVDDLDTKGQDDLKKRLEDLEKAERVARDALAARQRDLDDANRRAREAEERETKVRGEASSYEMDAVNNALAASQAESDAAQRDYEAALTNQDAKAQSDAQRRLSRAEARIVQFEDSKAILEDRAKRAQDAPKKETRDPLEAAIANLPDAAKTWLRTHSEYMTEPRKNAKIQSLHWDAIEAGNGAFTPSYFEWIEVQLGMRKAPKKEDDDVEDEPETRKERVITSAPVSRESPSLRDGRPTNQRITLSPEQREAARFSGVSEIEYAKQLIRMNEMKKSGLIQ